MPRRLKGVARSEATEYPKWGKFKHATTEPGSAFQSSVLAGSASVWLVVSAAWAEAASSSNG